MTAPRRAASDDRGQAVILMALMFSALLMFSGLAIDAGTLYVARRTMQEAADSGAYAGAVVLYQGGTETDAVNAATADVQRNGYVHNGNGGLVSVVARTRPLAGSHVGDARYVEVVVSDQVRTILVPGQAQLNYVRVRGVAGAEPLNNGYAIMALDRGSTPSALNVYANGTVAVTGAGILVNSTSATAATNAGTGNVTVTPTPAYGTQVAGNVSGSWPNLTTGIVQKPDPFAGYPRPSTTGMTTYSSLPGGNPNPMILDPGIYTVPISAAGGTRIVMNSGIYIVKAGINGAGNADIDSGAGGVFIFNTVMDYPASTGSCQSVRLTGNAASTLNPMTTVPYAGLLIYQDPACAAPMTISGNGNITARGTIYLPNALFQLNGANATLDGSQLVAKTIDVQNGTVTVNFNAGTTAQPVLPRLAE